MNVETVAPTPVAPPIQTPEEIESARQLTETNRAIDQGEPGDNVDDKPAKVEKTPQEREIARMQRALDRRTRQLYETRAKLEQGGLTREPIANNNRASADDSEPVSLTRAQLRELVNSEAVKLAPTLQEQQSETKRRQGVVEGLAKTWGKERFDELASDLDDAFGGLADGKGSPRAATQAVFEADEPAKVIEYLADPDNLDEAERISRMSAVQAGRAIARLEDKLKATANATPRPSQAPAPLEPVRGQGAGKEKRLIELSDKEFAERRRQQIAQGR